MSNFRILDSASRGAMRFVHTTVDTGLVDDVAHATVTTTKGMANPLYVLTFGQIGTGAFRPDIYARTTNNVLRGTGASAFDDAVTSLHELGRTYGVNGISLSTDPTLYGGLRLQGSSLYISGRPIIDAIGRKAAFQIDAASRRVMDLVSASA